MREILVGCSRTRLLIPVLRFLFHIPEIQYFSGFQGILQYSFFSAQEFLFVPVLFLAAKTVIRIPAVIPVSYYM